VGSPGWAAPVDPWGASKGKGFHHNIDNVFDFIPCFAYKYSCCFCSVAGGLVTRASFLFFSSWFSINIGNVIEEFGIPQ